MDNDAFLLRLLLSGENQRRRIAELDALLGQVVAKVDAVQGWLNTVAGLADEPA